MSEEGFFYTGYHRAYERVRAHFASEEAGLLVVTGQRARGKSALLARVGVLSCVRYVTLLGEQAEPAVAGYARLSEPLDAAVFARAKNVDALASEIARQLGVEVQTAEELVGLRLEQPPTPRIVIDGVDESVAPRDTVRALAGPLAASGARIAIGLHRSFTSVLSPGSAHWVDLDGEYRDDDALPKYVAARLRAAGKYSSPQADKVAGAMATRAAGNFLMAELAGRTLARAQPINTDEPGWERRLPENLDDAFRDYLASSTLLAVV